MSCGHAQIGDKVRILWGGQLPFLLRENRLVDLRSEPNEFERTVMSHVLVRGAYCVHGIADGEGIEMAQQLDIREEDFCLV